VQGRTHGDACRMGAVRFPCLQGVAGRRMGKDRFHRLSRPISGRERSASGSSELWVASSSPSPSLLRLARNSDLPILPVSRVHNLAQSLVALVASALQLIRVGPEQPCWPDSIGCRRIVVSGGPGRTQSQAWALAQEQGGDACAHLRPGAWKARSLLALRNAIAGGALR
jgi:hypothetical protein